MLVRGILLLKSLLRAKVLLLNSSLVAVCSQTNSGLVTSLLGLLLARMLKGVWPGLLLDESVQLSLQTHHG